MASDLGNLHITRVESGVLTLGWNFRLRVAGRIESKFFSDRSYGGKENALAVARMYRNARLEQLGPKDIMRRVGRKNSRNSSGIVGVSRTTIITTNGKKYACWSAQWPLARGKHFIRRFSILKFGEEKARQLAIQARREGLKTLKKQRAK
jgi:hypothetical protein